MSIVSTSNRWLNRLYKTVAILLVLLAVMISAFRLFLPYVHHYRLPLQNYLNETSQTNIAIGNLRMTWQRFGPILVIGNVQILNTKSASVFIEQVELQIDFWQTMTQQALISENLIISGAKVDVSQQLWQSNQDNNTVNVASAENEENDIRVVSDLFLNRIKRFSILDSQLSVKNKDTHRSLRLNQLHWLNTGKRHQAQGSVVLNGLSSNNLQLKLDLEGERGSELSGQVYLQANHIDITPWLDNILVLDDDKTKTDINFSAWLRVNNSKLNRLQVNLSDSDMSWSVEKKQQNLNLEQGQILLVKGKKEGSFKLYSTPLALTFNDHPSQLFTAMLAKEPDNFSLHLSEIDLAMLAQLTPLIVGKQETRKLISNMALSGKVEDLYLRNKDSKLHAIASFSKFNNNYSYGIPGLENVSGQLSFIDNYLAIDFVAEQGELDFDKLFVQAFPYDKLSGQLNVAFDDIGWALTVDQFDFLSKEINLSAQIKVEDPVDGEVNLALLANVSNGNAGLVGRYLPLPIMSENLVDYLNAAVVSGRVEDAQVLINGPIGRFPFTDGSGIFVVDAELSNAEFKFVEDWPAITDFVANLNFTNNSMLITGRGGQLSGLDVTGVKADIVDLANGQILTVDADIKSTPTSNIINLMNQSPLEDSVGATLEHLQVSGNVSGEFHLNLPLNDNEQTLANGIIHFDNNDVALQVPEMNFSKVKGQLSFSNDKITTNDLQLMWKGLPISLEILGINKADYYETNIQLAALWKESEWLPHVPQKLRAYTAGELPWQGELSLYQHHQGGFSYEADFFSDLNNTQLTLPAPFDRNLKQENDLSVQVTGQIAQSNIVLNYGDKIHFSGLLAHESTAFTRANLTLGESRMVLPSDGFHITTQLGQVDISIWQPLISDILDTVTQQVSKTEQVSSTPFLAKPKRIRGSIDQLHLLGEQLNNVSFNLLDKPDWLLLELNANETRSQIKIYPDWLARGLDINAEFLHLKRVDEQVKIEPTLATTEPDKAQNDIIFANIPPFTFHCDTCSIGALALGEVDVEVKRVEPDIIEFTQLKATRDNAEIILTGQWLHNEKQSRTTLLGKVSVDDIESELQALSFDSTIKDSSGEMDLNLNWSGGVHDFDITRLNGNLSARLGDGYLVDASDKEARILSVLSLQSVVRKLKLDFRDVFSDGMFYSSITGDYKLEEGIFTTDNTEMNGTAGNLFMSGHTNFTSGELDYQMSYKPELTSSLPIVAWIVTLNPVIFAAGVAIDQVIKSQVVYELNFELTGTIENPDFKEVERKSKNISLDNTVPTKDEQLEPDVDKNPESNTPKKAEVNNG